MERGTATGFKASPPFKHIVGFLCLPLAGARMSEKVPFRKNNKCAHGISKHGLTAKSKIILNEEAIDEYPKLFNTMEPL